MTSEDRLMQDPTTLPLWPLPAGITSRYVDTSPISLKFHILEAVPAKTGIHAFPPLILCVHGYPNLAYDWRYILPKLAQAGFHAVAFDQRGYGRTHDASLKPIPDSSFRPLNLVRDVVALVHALGHDSIHTIVGHDFGASASALCALIRPDFIKSLVLMSHPYPGPPKVPYATSTTSSLSQPPPSAVNPYEALKDPHIHDSLLKLSPPRKHYKWYNTTPNAPKDWSEPVGRPLHDFLRGYFHTKSADYTLNDPRPLRSWTADQLQVMPYYYIMLANHGMRENIATAMQDEDPAAQAKLSSCTWLSDRDLDVYVTEWSRTTFRQALSWYKILTDPNTMADIQTFASAKISIPTKFVSGVKDWGNYQEPGAIEAMETGRSVRKDCYRGTTLVDGAGHWVNMEQPERCCDEILQLANSVGSVSNFGWTSA